MQIAAVVVAFHPPAGFVSRVRQTLSQVERVVIVDNGRTLPDGVRNELNAEREVTFIDNPTNLGIATALNQGIRLLLDSGFEWILTLDHDSELSPGFVSALDAGFDVIDSAEEVAALCPTVRYGHPDIRCRWPRELFRGSYRFNFVYADEIAAPTEVDLAITSGMLISAAVWKRVGGFDESLFIDLVDTEYCLRCRRDGLHVYAVPGATIIHELGCVSKQSLAGLLPVYPTHHAATRHYYIARNRIRLLKKYRSRFPAWAAYELLGALKLTIKTMLYERDRVSKFISFTKGTIDGFSR